GLVGGGGSPPGGRCVGPGGGRSPPPTGQGASWAIAPHSGHAGVVAGIHKGYFRRSIAESAYRFAEECEAKDRIIVGVNEYIDEDEERQIDILEISHQVEVDQVERLAAFKAKRDGAAVERSLEAIRAACRAAGTTSGGGGVSPPQTTANDRAAETPPRRQDASATDAGAPDLHPTNVMPALVEAALAGCTLGEMVQAMADIYGRYTGGPEW
ncbi:MAG: methylmalonyl-CoA mutase family protein, partial [Planctomycetota bacterium]